MWTKAEKEDLGERKGGEKGARRKFEDGHVYDEGSCCFATVLGWSTPCGSSDARTPKEARAAKTHFLFCTKYWFPWAADRKN